jgi:hypothetical protein
MIKKINNNEEYLKLISAPFKNTETFISSSDLYSFEYQINQYKHVIKIRDYRDGYLKRLLFHYTEAFAEFEIFLEECLGLAQEIYNLENKNDLQKAICKLHSNAILRVNEVLCLLQNGFSDGALIIWRSLFETTITAIFITNRYLEGDTEIAKRYLEYEIVFCYKKAELYKKSADILDFESLDESDENALQNKCEELKKNYGKFFCKKNGWINPNDEKCFQFEKMMEETENYDMKIFYTFASEESHPASGHKDYKMGLIYGTYHEKNLMNSSNIGLTDPAQITLLNLWQITGILCFGIEKKYLEIVLLKNKIREIAKCFLDTEKGILKEEKKYSSEPSNA